MLKSSEAAAITALDHVVVRTPNPERAIALYAGRLGLDLRLDRSNPDWGSRLLFFRCGDLVVEIAHDLKKGVSDAPDQLWGLSWRTPDIAKANERLKKAGVEVSEPRNGRRPGTQVFTVQSHTANVPTIVIGGLVALVMTSTISPGRRRAGGRPVVSPAGRAADGFDVVALGALGGIEDGNLSAWLVHPHDDSRAVTFDAGTLVNGLRVAEEKGASRFDQGADRLEAKPRRLRPHRPHQGLLVSHAHLDHVAGW